MEFNKYQSSLEELNIDKYPDEVKEQFFDFINNVPFIKWMISKDRPYAKDLPRDKDGKIIFDVTKPPILEDMDYFRQAALTFQKTGKYTELRPNYNPNSEYGKWIREEIRRCYEGMVRPSDGMWITGDMYFMLNYFPMFITRINGKSKKGERVIDFPEVWEGINMRFHYIYQAIHGGLFNPDGGQNGCEISSRGKAHPYSQLVYTPDGVKTWGEINIGDTLYSTYGTTKVIDIPFNEECTIFKVVLNDDRFVLCSLEHLWRIEEVDICISTRDIINRLANNYSCTIISNFKDSSSSKNREVKSVTLLGTDRAKCVTVDSEDNCYLIGDFVTTHNSKSYSMASMLSKRFVLGESKEVKRGVKCMATAYQKQYLTSDGILNKFQAGIDFLAQNTQFPKRRLKNSLQDMSWKMGYVDLDTGTQKGTLNEVIGVSAKDDSSKVRGKRQNLIIIEEFGSFRNVLELYNILIPSVQEGDISFGSMYLIGTSGDDESDFQGAQEIVYNPKGYRMYALPNVYDKEGQGRSTITFFFGGYLNRKGCYDKDGNSDVTKALLEILENRYRVKYNSSDINSVTKTIAEIPITPQEAILRTKGNLFPITQLNERLNELDNNPNEYDDVYIGNLVLNSSGKVEFRPSNDIPIREFPTKDNKVKGAIEIFQMPVIDKATGKPYSNRYILGHDPVDDDTANTMSLTSTFVLDLFTDRIVAEYTGRQDYADDNFEIVRLLCLFYNGKCLYEQNKKGIFSYFSRMNCVYLLADTPEYLKDKHIIKDIGYGNKAKGVNAITSVNNFANERIKEWLIKPIPKIINDGNEDKEITVPNLSFLRNRALIKELILFNPDINVDRVRALGMLMLYREEFIIKYQGNMSQSKIDSAKTSYLGNDPFFNNNYK